MRITINQRIFDVFPEFYRGVIIADNIRNAGEDAQLLGELRALEEKIHKDPVYRDYKNLERVSAWRSAFERMGVNPNVVQPSVASLLKRVVNGGRLPYINTLVSCFNVTSLEALVPCGGDDLSAVNGDLHLRLAKGTETYHPLARPEQIETVPEGEIIYADSANVLCRAWCWRNGDVTKIQSTTTRAAINVDGLPPLTKGDVRAIVEKLAERLRLHCGAGVAVYFLSRESPEVVVPDP